MAEERQKHTSGVVMALFTLCRITPPRRDYTLLIYSTLFNYTLSRVPSLFYNFMTDDACVFFFLLQNLRRMQMYAEIPAEKRRRRSNDVGCE